MCKFVCKFVNILNCNQQPNEKNTCAIPIKHFTKLDVDDRKYPSVVYEHYRMWKQNDYFLDFYGAETLQGNFEIIKIVAKLLFFRYC